MGCRDDQTSLDITLSGKPCGALTNCLQEALNDKEGTSSDYEALFKNVCANMDNLRKSIPRLSQCPQFTYSDRLPPSSVSFCNPSSIGDEGGYSPVNPPIAPSHGKQKKEKKEKKEKAGKEKKEKRKKE